MSITVESIISDLEDLRGIFRLAAAGELDDALLLAAELGETLSVHALIKKGANVRAKSHEGATPLHLAARQGHVEIARALIEHGANVNAKDRYGDTPLQSAAPEGRINTVLLLIEKGAKVNTTGGTMTPLQFAAGNGHTNVALTLIEAGARLKPSQIDKRWDPTVLKALNNTQTASSVISNDKQLSQAIENLQL